MAQRSVVTLRDALAISAQVQRAPSRRGRQHADPVRLRQLGMVSRMSARAVRGLWPTICRVSTTDVGGQLIAWCELPSPSAPAGENVAACADEDRFLDRFAGLAALDRGQAAELVGWKFQSMPHRKVLAVRGISHERWDGRDGAPGAAGLIRTALAACGVPEGCLAYELQR